MVQQHVGHKLASYVLRTLDAQPLLGLLYCLFCGWIWHRDGILQAIIDRHSSEVNKLRETYIARAQQGEWPAAEAAARCLAMPIIDYIESNTRAVNFVRIVSQINAAYPLWQNQAQGSTGNSAGKELPVHYPRLPQLEAVFNAALGKLGKTEARHRTYLAVNISFHSIADIFRSDEQALSAAEKRSRTATVQQLIYALESFFAAPPIPSDRAL